MIEIDGCLVEGESTHPVIEEEVDGLTIKFEDQHLEEVDIVVNELLVAHELAHKVMLDQLRHEWIPKQVEEVGSVFDVLHEDASGLDYLDVDQAMVEC